MAERNGNRMITNEIKTFFVIILMFVEMQIYNFFQNYFVSFKNVRTFAPDFARRNPQKNTSMASELLLRFRRNLLIC